MTIRAKVFFLIARMKKKSIIKHLQDLNSSYSFERNEKILSSFLNFSTANSPYYSRYSKYNNLHDFPIMNKNDIKENYDILKTPFKDDDNHIMQTSGSSGVPFKIHQNVDKRNRVIAELIYFNDKANYKFGSKLIYFKNFNDTKLSILKNLFVKNIINIDVKKLSDQEIFKIYKKLNKQKNVNILGYASAIEKIGLYIYNNDLKLNEKSINSIITTSELLTDKNKYIWKKLTGIDIVSRYANQENGFLAQTIQGESGYKLNHSSYYFEFINIENNEPAEPEERARIIITDLYNKSIPLIRYDTGDIGTYTVNSLGEKTLTSLEGRLRDYILDTKGKLLSPSVITKMMWDFYDISGFQFVQKSNDTYVLKIIDVKEKYSDLEFINILKSQLGSNANISIERVEKIKKLASGKTELVRNEYRIL